MTVAMPFFWNDKELAAKMGKDKKAEIIYKKLSTVIPEAKNMGWDENWFWKDLGPKIFKDDKDREQFIREY